MKIRNIVALTIILGSTAAMAVQKPSITPLLGTYKGDCRIMASGQKLNDATELKLERDGQKVKISLASSLRGTTSVTSLAPNKEHVEIDNETNTKVINLLTVNDTQLRKWTLLTRTTNTADSGFDATERTNLDFSKSSVVSVRASGTFGGEVTFSSFCTLEKMNIRAK